MTIDRHLKFATKIKKYGHVRASCDPTKSTGKVQDFKVVNNR